jgi:squalene cyclase
VPLTVAKQGITMKVMCLSKTLILASVLLQSALWSTAASADADSARNQGAAWLVKQQRGDGSWASAGGELPVQATSTAILALKNAGLSRSPTYGAAVGWLANADVSSVDSIARKIEGLAAAGMRASSQNEADRLFGMRSVNYQAVWSGYGGSNTDLIDTALGLGALRMGDANYFAKANDVNNPTIVNALCVLGVTRINFAPGKPWPATPVSANQSMGQGRPSVVATALILNELRSMKLIGFNAVTCAGNISYDIETLQADSRAWLIDQQNPDGGFGEQRTDGSKGPSNVLVTAWVYRALSRQASPPSQAATALNWLLQQQDTSTTVMRGSWRGDSFVTAAVVAALAPASGNQLADADRDGITNVVEAQLGSNQNVADARSPLKAPSLFIPGTTASAFTANATVGQPFNYSLGAGSSFRLVTGALPPGLRLSVTGGITGTPQQAGVFSFDYVSNGSDTKIGRIDVATAPPPQPPVPTWLPAILEMLLDD